MVIRKAVYSLIPESIILHDCKGSSSFIDSPKHPQTFGRKKFGSVAEGSYKMPSPEVFMEGLRRGLGEKLRRLALDIFLYRTGSDGGSVNRRSGLQ